jgi:hypothetical protein
VNPSPSHVPRRLLAAVALSALAATGCTGSTPSDKRVAIEIVESMADDRPGGTLDDVQQECMIDKIDGYSEAELEAIGNAPENLALDPNNTAEFPAEGTAELRAFVADLETCTSGEAQTSTDTTDTTDSTPATTTVPATTG